MMAAPTLAGRVDALVIGASAGGIEALLVLLPALPKRCRAPVLVVLHVPRTRPSLLAHLFAPRCALAVVEAEDKMPIEPGTVYFAPPDYHLLVDRGPSIALSVDAVVNYSRPAIDPLFESAADIYGKRLVAVLLTGANDDGADGVAAVRRGGGVIVVQDPATAVAPAMPAAALRRVTPDFVLPLDAISRLLHTLDAAIETR